MKQFIIYILISIFLLGCEKDEINIETTGKVKTIYTYSSSSSSSSDNTPYAFTSFFYDDNWNLSKELISDNPKPIYASTTYEYYDNGKLLNKKYKVKLGENYPEQTESDFSLVREYKYAYLDNKKIEKEYRENELTDSVIYTYLTNLLTLEKHFDIKNQSEWSIAYEYNSDDNLVKRTSYPDGNYTFYFYENSKIQKTLQYDNSGSLLVENTFIYSELGDKEIVETYYKGTYGEYVSDKVTYKNGNIIETIKYHPTFQGAEWYCKRYEYY